MNGYTPRGGEFATAPRGGLDREQVREIEAHRAKERPTPWSALAKRYGRCEADIRALFDPKPENDNAPAPAPAMTRESRDDAFTRMWEAGMPLQHICTALSITFEFGKQCRLRLGLEPRRRGGNLAIDWTPQMDAVILREYLTAGRSADAVSRDIGVSRNALIGRATRLGYIKQGQRAA